MHGIDIDVVRDRFYEIFQHKNFTIYGIQDILYINNDIVIFPWTSELNCAHPLASNNHDLLQYWWIHVHVGQSIWKASEPFWD